MIYSPSKNPEEAFIMISAIVAAGIAGSVFLSVFFAVVGLFSIFYISPVIAYISLAAWWLFSFNFYRHYRQFKNS